MSDTSPKSPKKTTPCMGCGGSGQTQYFGGESRFMFTYEDCPDCHGTGIVLEEDDNDPAPAKPDGSKAGKEQKV